MPQVLPFLPPPQHSSSHLLPHQQPTNLQPPPSTNPTSLTPLPDLQQLSPSSPYSFRPPSNNCRPQGHLHTAQLLPNISRPQLPHPPRSPPIPQPPNNPISNTHPITPTLPPPATPTLTQQISTLTQQLHTPTFQHSSARPAAQSSPYILHPALPQQSSSPPTAFPLNQVPTHLHPSQQQLSTSHYPNNSPTISPVLWIVGDSQLIASEHP